MPTQPTKVRSVCREGADASGARTHPQPATCPALQADTRARGPNTHLLLHTHLILQVDTQPWGPSTHLVLHKLAAVIQLHVLLPRGHVSGGQCQAAQCVQTCDRARHQVRGGMPSLLLCNLAHFVYLARLRRVS